MTFAFLYQLVRIPIWYIYIFLLHFKHLFPYKFRNVVIHIFDVLASLPKNVRIVITNSKAAPKNPRPSYITPSSSFRPSPYNEL